MWRQHMRYCVTSSRDVIEYPKLLFAENCQEQVDEVSGVFPLLQVPLPHDDLIGLWLIVFIRMYRGPSSGGIKADDGVIFNIQVLIIFLYFCACQSD